MAQKEDLMALLTISYKSTKSLFEAAHKNRFTLK